MNSSDPYAVVRSGCVTVGVPICTCATTSGGTRLSARENDLRLSISSGSARGSFLKRESCGKELHCRMNGRDCVRESLHHELQQLLKAVTAAPPLCTCGKLLLVDLPCLWMPSTPSEGSFSITIG